MRWRQIERNPGRISFPIRLFLRSVRQTMPQQRQINFCAVQPRATQPHLAFPARPTFPAAADPAIIRPFQPRGRVMATQDAGGLGLFIGLYVLSQIALGLYFARNVKSDTDFFLAGRDVGLIPIAFSIFATWFSAETIIGSAGAISSEGLAGARAEPFGYALCLFAMGFWVAGAFRAKGYDNLAAFFRDRFDQTSEIFTAVITILVSTIWAAAQMLALSVMLKTALGVPEQTTLIVAAIVIIVYTATSGIVGDIYTDMIHAGVLIVGLLAVLWAVTSALGGFGPMLAKIEPSQLALRGETEGWLAQIDAWSIPILGSLVTQEVIARFLSAKDAQSARTATFAAGGMYLALGFVPVLIALAGVHVITVDAGDTDAFLPTLAAQILPPFVYVLFAGALISAVMSTTNSNVLSVSSMVSLTLLATVRKQDSARARLWAARLSTVGAGLAAYLIAISGQSIYELIALTSVWGQAGILVAVIIGVHSSYGGKRAALWAILACLAVNLVTMAIFPLLALMSGPEAIGFGAAMTSLLAGEAPSMSGYFLYSMLASTIAYVAGAEADKRANRIAKPHRA
jgi:SSS family transporter